MLCSCCVLLVDGTVVLLRRDTSYSTPTRCVGQHRLMKMLRSFRTASPYSGFNFVFRCKCGNCQIMDRREECVFCQEIDPVFGTMLAAVAKNHNRASPCIQVFWPFAQTSGCYELHGSSSSSSTKILTKGLSTSNTGT